MGCRMCGVEMKGEGPISEGETSSRKVRRRRRRMGEEEEEERSHNLTRGTQDYQKRAFFQDRFIFSTAELWSREL